MLFVSIVKELDSLLVKLDGDWVNIKSAVEIIKKNFYSYTWVAYRKCWVIPFSRQNLELLNKLFKPSITSELQNILSSTFDGDFVHINKEKMFKFQEETVKKVYKAYRGKERGFLVGHEMGLGKTICSIISADVIGLPKLVIVPASLVFQWCQEIRQWSELKTINIINKKNKELKSDCWNIITYNFFVGRKTKKTDLKYQPFYETINLFDYLIIIDEASYIKNHSSQRTKVIQKKCQQAKFRIALTGTPVSNSIYNFYNIMNFLNPNFISLYKFNSEFLVFEYIQIYDPKKREKKTVKKPVSIKNVDTFLELIKPLYWRQRKEEVAQFLPTKTVQYRFTNGCSEKEELKKILVDNKEEFKTFIDVFTTLKLMDCDSTLNESTSEITNKLKTLVNKTEFILDKNKEEEILSILEESESNVVIFTTYEKFAQKISKFLTENGISNLMVSSNNRQDYIEFVNSSEYRVLVTTDTLAYGINLDKCDVLINADLTPSIEVLLQRNDRIHRINSTRNKLIVNLVGSIVEEDIYNLLKEKALLIEQITELKGSETSSILSELSKKYGFENHL